MNLTPHYKGTFEAFRHNGNQYARLKLPFGYVWFSFDFFTECYKFVDNEPDFPPEFQEELENAYQSLKRN